MLRLAASLLVIPLLLLAACGSGERSPDILLISIDTLRADRLGCYGYELARTSTIDSLAAHGVTFDAATSVSPLTLPAHASMLSGRYPHDHGARNNGILPSNDVELVSEVLRDAGYRTAAVVSAAVLDARYGLSRGFDHYDDPPEGSVERNARATTDRALNIWTDLGRGPLLLWVHFFDPHHPYEPDGRGDPYDAEIARVDRELGRLLAAVRQKSPQAIVLLMADHGEALGEHGELQHGMLLYQSTLRVPLILTDPRDPESNGRRIESPVSTIDVAATLRDLAGLELRPGSSAQSLRAPIERRAVVSETLVPFHNHGASPLASLRSRRWKYIQAPRPELYDLVTDPFELQNRWGNADSEEFARRLAELLPLDWMSSATSPDDPRVDPQSRDLLGTLGYLANTKDDLVELVDPKDVVAALHTIRRAEAARRQGDLEGAEADLRDVLETLPENWRATWKLGDLLISQSRFEDAVELYEEAARRSPRNLAIWLRVAEGYRLQGYYVEALSALNRVRRQFPDHPQANIEHALTIAAMGERGRALEQLRELSAKSGDPAYRSAIEELSGDER